MITLFSRPNCALTVSSACALLPAETTTVPSAKTSDPWPRYAVYLTWNDWDIIVSLYLANTKVSCKNYHSWILYQVLFVMDSSDGSFYSRITLWLSVGSEQAPKKGRLEIKRTNLAIYRNDRLAMILICATMPCNFSLNQCSVRTHLNKLHQASVKIILRYSLSDAGLRLVIHTVWVRVNGHCS